MKKSIFVFAICLVMGLSACGKKNESSDSQMNEVSGNITYSNLNDEKTRNEVRDILLQNNLPVEDVDKVMGWVKSFDDISTNYQYQDGFVDLSKEGVDYSLLILDDTKESYEYLQWLNCRLTAFSLIEDAVETSKNANEFSTWLMFDLEALETVSEIKVSDEKKLDFTTLFNQVDVSNTKTVQEHEERITKAWKDRNIQVNSESISLVCLYLHSPEDQIRFVGHAGILVNLDDGLLFFEKYSNLLPFQATKFEKKSDLRNYLLSRKDLYGSEDEMAPIITVNSEILK